MGVLQGQIVRGGACSVVQRTGCECVEEANEIIDFGLEKLSRAFAGCVVSEWVAGTQLMDSAA